MYYMYMNIFVSQETHETHDVYNTPRMRTLKVTELGAQEDIL